jgi:signal transduction histidine kinase
LFLALVLPLEVRWAPVIAGALLFNLASSAHGLPRFGDGLLDMFRDPRRRASRVRSHYEEQIRQAAQKEERARLARELHDAVKQQLFVVQTAAATAQARYDTDPAGARAAIAWVRRAGREAMTEMDALLQQLQSPPIENAGLVDALKMLVEALGFRTGADVRLEVGDLPPSDALPPGSQQAVFRAAQEAVSNVARHARARHVDVVLDAIGGCLRLTVADDGRGSIRPPIGSFRAASRRISSRSPIFT